MPRGRTTLLQTAFGVFESEADKLYAVLNKEITKNINKGMTIAKAVDTAFIDVSYTQNMESLYSKVLGDVAESAVEKTTIAVDSALASEYFLNTQFVGGLSLSDRLHSKDAQRAVKEVLRDQAKKATSVETVFSEIKKKGFSSLDRIPDSMTKAIAEFKKIGLTPAVEKELNKLQRQVSKLSFNERSNKALQKSYQNVINVMRSDKTALIDKAVDRAVQSKVSYLNKRIARTEIARSYEMSFQRAMYEDDDIVGFEWVLSSAHPRTDICDFYADADLYGIGEGVYPKDASAPIPAHPNCLCQKNYIMAGDTDIKRKPQYSQKRANKYLSNIGDKERGNIIGVGNAQSAKTYQTGLAKQGVDLHKNPKMIPQTLFTTNEP